MFEFIGAVVGAYKAFVEYENSRSVASLHALLEKEKTAREKIVALISTEIVNEAFQDAEKPILTLSQLLDQTETHPTLNLGDHALEKRITGKLCLDDVIAAIMAHERDLKDPEVSYVRVAAMATRLYMVCAAATYRQQTLTHVDLSKDRDTAKDECRKVVDAASEGLRRCSDARFKLAFRERGIVESDASVQLIFGYEFNGQWYEDPFDIGYVGQHNSGVSATVTARMARRQEMEFPIFHGVAELNQMKSLLA